MFRAVLVGPEPGLSRVIIGVKVAEVHGQNLQFWGMVSKFCESLRRNLDGGDRDSDLS